MKEYKFECRSTRDGFTEWASCTEDGVEVKRVDRNVHLETVTQFRERVEGFVPAPHQYTL